MLRIHDKRKHSLYESMCEFGGKWLVGIKYSVVIGRRILQGVSWEKDRVLNNSVD